MNYMKNDIYNGCVGLIVGIFLYKVNYRIVIFFKLVEYGNGVKKF